MRSISRTIGYKNEAHKVNFTNICNSSPDFGPTILESVESREPRVVVKSHQVKQALVISVARSDRARIKAQLQKIKQLRGQWPVCRDVPVFSDDVVFCSGCCTLHSGCCTLHFSSTHPSPQNRSNLNFCTCRNVLTSKSNTLKYR